jgi:hypothetical protein
MKNLPAFIRCSCVRYFGLLIATLLMGATFVNAQTPQPANPIGSNQLLIPQFSAVASSLVNGVTYGISISESPRGGANSQYIKFWTKSGISVSDLLASNPNRVAWSSGWEQRIRSGSYDSPVTTIIPSSPATLAQLIIGT